MTEAQKMLKADIEKITDETMIEKIWIFIMGIQAQQNIELSAGSSQTMNGGQAASMSGRIKMH